MTDLELRVDLVYHFLAGNPVLPRAHCIMPHTTVISPTGKIRIINKARAETASGLSLNDESHVGPNTLKDGQEIILNSRRHNVMFSYDLRQMNLQVAVHPDDQQYRLILWRSNGTEPLRLYQYTSVTFGVASSAFLTACAFKKLAAQLQEQFPSTYEMLVKENYVDDAAGISHVKDTLQLHQELSALLDLGKLKLR